MQETLDGTPSGHGIMSLTNIFWYLRTVHKSLMERVF